jgi:hypothetical protein
MCNAVALLRNSKCLMAQDCCLLWKGFWWLPLDSGNYSVLLSSNEKTLKSTYSRSSRVHILS